MPDDKTSTEMTPLQERVQAMAKDLYRLAKPADEPDPMFVYELMGQILSAESEDEIWQINEDGATSGKDMVNRPFQLKTENVEFIHSMYKGEDAFPFYVRLEVTEMATDEIVNFNCGGKTLVTTIYALFRGGMLDKYADIGGRPMVITEKGTLGGNTALVLKPVAVPRRSARAPY
jgi:hypothetical protein